MPSSTPPPSYSSATSTRSSTSSKKHRPTSAEKDKQNHKDKPEHDVKVTDNKHSLDADDVLSIKSQLSTRSSATTSSTQSALDTLRDLAGSGIRRSKCRAEFLEELAKGSGLTELDKDVAEKLRIITGKAGVDFFRKFIGEEPLGIKGEEDKEEYKKIFANPVVFAVCVVEAGRKVLDYYMTWRGKTRAKDLKGHDRKESLLDEEFRRVARTIDKGYKRQAREGHDNDDSRSSKSSKSRKPHLSSHKRSSLPPNIVVSPPEAVLDTPSPATPTANRTSSANDSVISLPFLGAIRNVPLSNRLPLRVTNPDRNSVAESSAVVEEPVTQPTNNNSLETLVEASESAENGPPDPERQASPDTLVHASDADQMLEPPKKEPYTESVSSSGSRSSRSSRSRSHRHKSGRRSSSKKHHESSRGKSDHKEHGHSSSARHRDKDGEDAHSTRSHRHHHHHHRSSKHHDEKKEKDEDDRSSRKSNRKGSSSSKRPLQSNITLVMVDPDEVDRASLKAVKKEVTKGGPTWHGLAVLPRASKPAPAAVNTPWMGPLARTSDGIRKILPYNLDSDEDDWEGVPGIPKREPVIPPPSSDWESDDSSSSPSITPPHRPVYPLPGSQHGASVHATPVYPLVNNLSPPPGSTYGPQAPVLPYSAVSSSQTPYAYSSPNLSLHSLSSSVTIKLAPGTPLSTSYTPSYIPPPSLVTSPTASNSSLPNTAFPPGFVPQTITSPAGVTNALPSIHALTDPAFGHGTSSPYLYSTPRPTLGSPYVPAWISPQSSTNVSLPGSLTPASARGVTLHPAGYGPNSRGTPPY